jgi:transcriptional regulator with XRE-family HTH domain
MIDEKSSLQMAVESVGTSLIKQQMLQSFQTAKEYRHAFVEEAIGSRIAAQIRTIREQRKWDYKRFAEEIGKKVSWVYRLEDPNTAPPTIPTLLQVAEAFDVGLDVRFCSFSELLNDVGTLSPESFSVPSFEEELKMGSFSQGRRRTRKVQSRSHRKARHPVPERPHHPGLESKVLIIGASRQQALAIAS